LATAAETGGSEILSYHVQWDQQTGGLSWQDVQGYTAPDVSTSIELTSGVTPGLDYQVRVRARNIYGYGDYSAVTTIRAAQEPDAVAPASLSSVVSGTNVAFSWTAPDANEDPITAYRVLIRQADGGSSEESTYCNGADPAILAAAACDVPFVALRAAPFSLAQGDAVQFTVAAYNSYGWAAASQENYVAVAAMQAEPAAPSAPVYDAASSTMSSLVFSWAGIAADSFDTGGSPVLSYNLQMKVGSATAWTDVQGQDGAYSTALTATATTGVVAGETHTLRLRAANAHGWGAYSAEVAVVASGVPDQPAAPTTALENLDVKISWTAPAAHHATITAYSVRIEDATGAIVEETTHCDASADPILSQGFCLVPMAHVRTEHGLPLGAPVLARVAAQNLNGWSAESAPSAASVTVQTEPAQMPAVTNGSLTGPTQVQLLWDALTTDNETGAAAIITYNLQWHGGADDYGAAWVSLTGEVSDYVATSYIVTGGVVKGAAYRFRIRARNVWGWSTYSATA
jgi:hypothetical protein